MKSTCRHSRCILPKEKLFTGLKASNVKRVNSVMDFLMKYFWGNWLWGLLLLARADHFQQSTACFRDLRAKTMQTIANAQVQTRPLQGQEVSVSFPWNDPWGVVCH